jgi:hypothetical protein
MLRAAWAFIVLTVIAIAFGGLGAILSFRRGDPDAWLALPILVVAGLFPLACLWFSIWAMKSANRNAARTEHFIALFKALDSTD